MPTTTEMKQDIRLVVHQFGPLPGSTSGVSTNPASGTLQKVNPKNVGVRFSPRIRIGDLSFFIALLEAFGPALECCIL